MPFELLLPIRFRRARWKVKIRDKEMREPPHVTILKGTKAWRINLRSGLFMDRRPDPAAVPVELIDHVRSASVWNQLREEWDKKYPTNPVREE